MNGPSESHSLSYSHLLISCLNNSSPRKVHFQESFSVIRTETFILYQKIDKFYIQYSNMENILYKKLSSKGDDGSKYDVFVNFYDKNLGIMETVVDFELAAFSRYTDVSIQSDIITC